MHAGDALTLFLDGLYQLYHSNDKQLIDTAQERAAVAALMHHMRLLQPASNLDDRISIDCEYHRYGRRPYKAKRNILGNLRTPDLIVHQRGNNIHNFLLAEFKTWRRNNFNQNFYNDTLSKDREKIDLLNQNIQYELAFVVLLKKNGAHIELYRGSNPLGFPPHFEIVP